MLIFIFVHIFLWMTIIIVLPQIRCSNNKYKLVHCIIYFYFLLMIIWKKIVIWICWTIKLFHHFSIILSRQNITLMYNRNEAVFQQDRASPHYAHNVKLFLQEQFLNYWIGRLQWDLFNLIPLHFFLLSRLKYRATS